MSEFRRAGSGPRSPLLLDPRLEAQLADLGHLQVPMLASDQLEELRDLHERTRSAPGSGFDTDFVYLAPEHKQRIDAGIRAVVEAPIMRWFRPLRLFNVTFVVKWPGGGSELPLHQDWSYTDERTERSITIWLPLDDTSPELGNGPIALVPRSHRLPAFPRGANTLPWYHPHREAIASHLLEQTVPAGDALIFDNRVLHASGDNRTDAPRRAVAIMGTLVGTQLRYYHQADARMYAYAIDESFFVNHSPIDLRSHDFADVDAIEEFDAPDPRAPVQELAELGIHIEDRPTPKPDEFPMRGAPLGVARPATGAGSLETLARRLVSRRGGPVMAVRSVHPAVRSLVSVEWQQSADPEAVPVESGSATAAALRAPAPVDAWLLRLEPGTELVRNRADEAGWLLSFSPRSLGSRPGTAVVQVGDRILPLEPGRDVHIDPRWEHTLWNIGPDPVEVVVAVSPRSLPVHLQPLRGKLGMRSGDLVPVRGHA